MNIKIKDYIQKKREDKSLTEVLRDDETVKKWDRLGQNFQLDILETANNHGLFDE